MTVFETELARLKAERDHARLVLDDLIGLRSSVAMAGTEEELNAHDARFARAQRIYDRAVAALERFGSEAPNQPDASPKRRLGTRTPPEQRDADARPKNS